MPVGPREISLLNEREMALVDALCQRIDEELAQRSEIMSADEMRFAKGFDKSLPPRLQEEIRKRYEEAGWEAQIVWSRAADRASLQLWARRG